MIMPRFLRGWELGGRMEERKYQFTSHTHLEPECLIINQTLEVLTSIPSSLTFPYLSTFSHLSSFLVFRHLSIPSF